MKFKYAILGILKNKLFSLILLLQVIVGLFSLYNVFEINDKVQIESEKITGYFKDKKVYTLDFSSNMEKILEEDDDIINKKLERLFNELDEIEGIEIIQNNYNWPLAIDAFEGSQDFNKYNMVINIDGENFINANNTVVNDKFFEQFNVEISEGTSFKEDDFILDKNKSEIPIIVGSNYKKYYSVGDKIKCFKGDKIVDAVICGILKEDTIIPTDFREGNEDRYINLNNYIISSYSGFDSLKSKFMSFDSYNYVLINSDKSEEDIIEQLDKITMLVNNITGIKPNVMDINKSIRVELDTYKSQSNLLTFTTLTILVFITLMIIVTEVNTINKRKKEFIIHTFTGGTLKDVSVMVYLEVFIIMIFSWSITENILFFTKGYLNFKNSIYILLIITLISIISTIIPIIKILNLKVTDVMKGDD